MKSTAHVKGHPVHPMLIPYPFALLSSATVFDVGVRATGNKAWATTASHLVVAGVGTALLAAVPGIIDYFGSVPRRTQARRFAAMHALSNMSALACFVAAQRRRDEQGRAPDSGLLFSLAGTSLLALGGWLGGELVYRHRIAVVDETARVVNPKSGGTMVFDPDENEMEQTPPQTEDASERGFVPRDPETGQPETYRDLGQAEELGQDDVGDIADEGGGHRG
jgi:uncharacterized membrane protein